MLKMIRCCIVEIMRLIPLSPRLDFQTLLAFSVKQFKRRGESEFWTTCHTKKSRKSKDNMSQTKCENSNKFCLRNLSIFFLQLLEKSITYNIRRIQDTLTLLIYFSEPLSHKQPEDVTEAFGR